MNGNLAEVLQTAQRLADAMDLWEPRYMVFNVGDGSISLDQPPDGRGGVENEYVFECRWDGKLIPNRAPLPIRNNADWQVSYACQSGCFEQLHVPVR